MIQSKPRLGAPLTSRRAQILWLLQNPGWACAQPGHNVAPPLRRPISLEYSCVKTILSHYVLSSYTIDKFTLPFKQHIAAVLIHTFRIEGKAAASHLQHLCYF